MSRLRCAASTCLAAALALAVGCADADRPPTQDPSMKPTAPTTSATPNPAGEISSRRDEPWDSMDASFRASIDFDQPVTQKEAAMRGYRPDASYTGKKDWS